MKKVIIALSVTLFSMSTFAQVDRAEKDLKTQARGSADSTKAWDVGGNINMNVTQVALSNWAGGGQSSISLQGILGIYANYSKGKSAWDNNLDLAYGMIKTGSSNWFKNDDRIELNSKYGYKAAKNWYYAGLLNFRTQFAEGYGQIGDANPISNFMAPGYTTIAIGMDYKPNDKFSAFISPATLKITAVLDDSLSAAGSFGVPAGETIRTEFGGYVKLAFNEPKVFGNENLAFKANASFFSNYQDNPQNIDITADATISAKVAKYFTVSLSLNVIYDHDIQIQRYDGDTPLYLTREDGTNYLDEDNNPIPYKGPITQLKEVMALGFAYKF
jgi:hypothetical protein